MERYLFAWDSTGAPVKLHKKNGKEDKLGKALPTKPENGAPSTNGRSKAKQVFEWFAKIENNQT